MLLVIDVGNSHTSIGVFDDAELIHHWRVSTRWERTHDEYRLLLSGLLAEGPVNLDRAVLASVVPASVGTLRSAVGEMVTGQVLMVGPGIRTGLPMHVDHPREVGADRVVNAVAAKERYGTPVVVVDFGTATTFDAVDATGAYVGGAIAPGIEVSLDALVTATAALRRVEMTAPRSVIGKTTVEAMQSGLLYGYAGTVDGIVGRMVAELGDGPVHRVATGAIAPVLVPHIEEVSTVDEFLTLEGLRIVDLRNAPGADSPPG